MAKTTTEANHNAQPLKPGAATRPISIRRRAFVERADIFRPRFHFTAPKAWLNDPCAPIFYGGYYHLFYQYVPVSCQWGQPLLWGHSVSKDMVTWLDVYDAETPDAPRDPADESQAKTDITTSTADTAVEQLRINGDFGALDRQTYPIALQASDWFDHCAVFSGSIVRQGLGGRPALFYTGITQLPIHWTLPYVTGSEVQVMAVPEDDMLHHWRKAEEPIIVAPPPAFPVVGFRDPYVFRSVELDALLAGHFVGTPADVPAFEPPAKQGAPKADWRQRRQSHSEPAPEADGAGYYYLILGGGIKDEGGAVFLYRSADMARWEYDERFFKLFSQPGVANMPPTATGAAQFADWGNNWERPELYNLHRFGTNVKSEYYLLSFGIEGTADPHGGLEVGVMFRFKRSFGVSGVLGPQDSLLEPVRSERFDYGNFYASTAFEELEGLPGDAPVMAPPIPNMEPAPALRAQHRYYKFGWVREQILPMKLENGEFKTVKRPHQPFAGTLSLPRDVSLRAVEGILLNRTAVKEPLRIGSVEHVWMDVPALTALRGNARRAVHSKSAALVCCGDALAFGALAQQQASILSDGTMDLELDVTLCDTLENGSIEPDVCYELYIRLHRTSSSGQDLEETTRIVYNHSAGTVSVDRSASTLVDEEMHDEHGLFQLHRLKPSTGASPTRVTDCPLEPMRWRVVWDRSILEVFINNRFCLTTRIYPTLLLGLDNTFLAAQEAQRLGAAIEPAPVDALADRLAAAVQVDGNADSEINGELYHDHTVSQQLADDETPTTIERALTRRKSVRTKPNKELAFVDIGVRALRGSVTVDRVDLWTAFSTMYDAISI